MLYIYVKQKFTDHTNTELNHLASDPQCLKHEETLSIIMGRGLVCYCCVSFALIMNYNALFNLINTNLLLKFKKNHKTLS